MRPQLHSEECGVWGILWGREGVRWEKQTWWKPEIDPNTEYNAKMEENILSEFQHFAFYLWWPGGWPLLRMGWDEWMRVKSCVEMNICIKSSSSLAPSLSCPYKCSLHGRGLECLQQQRWEKKYSSWRMDYTRTSNLAHCYGQGEAGVYTLQTLGEGARSRNRFPTSPLPATLWPQLVVAYSDNISANIKIPVHPGYPGSSHNRRGQNCDFVMILFFARDFDFNLSKLRQKQTPGDHKLAGTGPQWSVGALSHTEIREIILYGLKLRWKQTTCLVCVANNKNYWVLFLSDLHFSRVPMRAKTSCSLKQFIRSDPAFKYSHSLLL